MVNIRKILRTRLPSEESLLEEGRSFSDRKTHHKDRATRDAFFEVTVKLDMKEELNDDESQFVKDMGGEDLFYDEYERVHTEYEKRLAGRAIHHLDAFHEYINPDEYPAEHHIWLCEKLEKLERREIRLLLISFPPGAAKSSYASRSFIQWYMGRHPSEHILSAGYNLNFVVNEFSKRNRGIIKSDRYNHIFPDIQLDDDYTAATLWALDTYNGRYNCRFFWI